MYAKSVIYQFDDVIVDLEKFEVRKGNTRVRLEPKAVEALAFLIENRGRLVEKKELLDAVWKDAFVTENAMTRVIAQLRKALGDDSKEAKYIETVPTRGYRFISDVAVTGKMGLETVLFEGRQRITSNGSIAENRFGRTEIKKVKSIAVLPFKPLGADSRNEMLELGMADTLINKLSSIREITVLSINTVRKYSSLDQDPVAAGQELGVDYVLEGNLQIVGEKGRATARLLSVRDGSAIWTAKCDEPYSNIFELQDSIAEHVAGALALTLTGDERRQLAKRYTESVEAYQHYILGRFYRRTQQTRDGWEKSIECFNQAIKKDPAYAPAYVGLAWTYCSLGRLGYWLPRKARQKAVWAVLKAVELDDELGDAHAVLGYIKEWDWDWSGAEKEFKRALELHPNSVEVNSIYASYLDDVGRPEESIAHKKRAQELDPMTPEASGHLANSYFMARQYDKAIELFLRAVEMDPNLAPSHSRLGQVYLQKGMYEAAITELQKAVAIENPPERWDRQPALAYAYAVSGNRSEAQKILDELRELSKQHYIPPFNFAVIYMGLGEKDKAFEWLGNACQERSQLLLGLKVDPLFDSLRSDSRFADLLRRVGLAL
jgi:DNA-binding winged helix-turn-helix (wHTH) protein/Tfp pilus assembly protein PilF